jgi:hypothetical protein
MAHPYYKSGKKPRNPVYIWLSVFFVLIVLIVIPWLLPSDMAGNEPFKALKTITTFPLEYEWEHIYKYEPVEGAQSPENEVEEPVEPGVTDSVEISDSYFPLKVGNKWIYEHKKKGGILEPDKELSSIKTMEVVGESKSQDITLYEVKVTENNATLTFYYFWDEDGLKLARNQDHPYRHTVLMMKLNPAINDTWNETGPRSPKSTVVGEEEVAVPAGTFSCICVEYQYSVSSTAKHTAWYAKGVGVISQHHKNPAQGLDEWQLIEFTHK